MISEFDLLIDAERFEEAVTILEPLVEQQSTPYERFRLGVCYFRLGRYGDASALLWPLAESNGELAREAQMVVAHSLKGLKRWREAAKAFERLLSIGRATPEERRTVKVLVAACLEEAGEWKEALEIYKDLGTTGTELDEEVLLRRAAVHEKILEWSEAERLYGEFVERFPENSDYPRALFKHAQALHELGRFARAAEEFEQLSTMEPASFLTEIAKEFAAKSKGAQQGVMKAAKQYQTRH